METLKELNRKTARAEKRPDRIIQFGEGNFLRAFVDWIIWKTDQKTGFNAGVVVVQPIEKGMIDMINAQDGLYHLNLQGIDKGQAVDSIEMVDVLNRGINPYREFDQYLALAENPDTRFIISNTTEAGIAFDPQCRFTDRPAASYPGKLTQLLYHRYEYFKGERQGAQEMHPPVHRPLAARGRVQGMVRHCMRSLLHPRGQDSTWISQGQYR